MSVSELSDENCRTALRYIIKRHAATLRQVESQLLADEQSIPPVEVVNEGADRVREDRSLPDGN